MKLPVTRSGLLLLVMLCCANAGAEQGDEPESGLDALERQLEMGRHEQLVARKAHADSVLAAFTTDGCSGGLSVGWEYLAANLPRFHAAHGTRPPWESCCILHDQAYHGGGPREASAAESFEARKQADLDLKACVVETGVKRAPELSVEYDLSTRDVEVLYDAIADLMYRAVRIGGMPCTGLPWRWGYGWPECD
jgi:hypothetical protein